MPLNFGVILPVLAATLVLAAPAAATSPDVVISQLYGGGGNSGAPLKNDYVELFNAGDAPVDVSGWSVQYASATGTTRQATTLSGMIQPKRYYLVQEAAGGNAGAAPLPAPDATGSIAMSASSGKVALVIDSVPLACGADCDMAAGVRDFVGYGGANDFEGVGAAPGLSNTTADLRAGKGCTDSDDNATDFSAGAPAPRNSASSAGDCAATPPPPPPAVPIHDIQGAGHTSPLAGEGVTTTGIVTATRSNGYHLQDPNPDSDERTSEGLFVFTGSSPAVAAGDAVSVRGRVTEFTPGGSSTKNLSTTELTGSTTTVNSRDNPVPGATVVGRDGRVPPAEIIDNDSFNPFDPDQDGIDFYESLEGMRVQVNDAVAVDGTSGFGEIPVVADDGAGASVRTARGGIVIRPDDFNPERIQLDDAISPDEPQVDVGDRFATPVIGVLDYSFGNFKLLPSAWPDVVTGGLQPESAIRATRKDQLAIATYNVENLDPGDGTRFDAIARQIVGNLGSPDILALQEVQDDNGPTNDSVVDASLTNQRLIAAIAAAGGPSYDFRQIDPVDDQDGGQPGGNIRVGFLFRTDREDLEFIDRPGGTATAATTVEGNRNNPRLSFSPGRIDPTNAAFADSRKPLAGEFSFRGRRLFVVNNHFNSKGGDDPLFGSIQPPQPSSETRRHEQARIVNAFAEQLLAKNANASVLVLGDLNDFEFSRTLSILKGEDLTNLVDTLAKPDRYSFIFEGNSQILDNTLVSRSLADYAEYDIAHINTELAESRQITDHDPGVTVLTLPPGNR